MRFDIMLFNLDPEDKLQIDRDYIMGDTYYPFDLYTKEELFNEPRSLFVFDIECYKNYFLCAFKNINNSKVVYVEESPDSDLDIELLSRLIWHHDLIGFNSINYDIPMIAASLENMDAEGLKQVSDDIIAGTRLENLVSMYGLKKPTSINHIDLYNLSPLSPSLKTLAGRLHSPRMQDLPFDPSLALTKEQADFVREYCVNDLDNTILLYKALLPQIELRVAISTEYGMDLRSKSDPQIAEMVLISEIEKETGFRSKRPTFDSEATFKYSPPEYLKFEHHQLKDALYRCSSAIFCLSENGAIQLPKELEGFRITIGKSTYQMGIGGLHSTEKSQSLKVRDGQKLFDRDVNSFYPQIILNLELFPKQCKKSFLKIYRSIVERRLLAKKNGDKVSADSLKICVNSSFGKFGSRYSALYSPQLLLQVTLTGQLSLLMLIEWLEWAGISVISANTDGIVILCEENQTELYLEIINAWEERTGFKTEETAYKALYSRDINNYIAIKTDNKVKLKGTYALESLSKNPQNLICTHAVIEFIVNEIPIEQTIRECTDVTQFITTRNVKGGAHKNGKFLGKVVRFYLAKNEFGAIHYISSGHKVPQTDGAKSIMMFSEFPDDIDYARYIQIAKDILNDIGYWSKPQQKGLFE